MSKRLLVTDDAVIIRELIKEAAIEAGWEIVGEATNGKEGFEAYKELRPDAMTLDLVMPHFDGLYALKNIREFDPDAKVIVVSALDQKNILKDAFKLGATDFMIKPFERTQLVETLERTVVSSPDVASTKS